MNKIIAIHQPNFFPWLGYFSKIARSDTFIFLDDVQFPKKGGSWSNRVQLLIGGRSLWVTAAIDRKYQGLREIREMCFRENDIWREKIIKSIEANYIKHPFYEETMSIIKPLLENEDDDIAEYNIRAVTDISNELGLTKCKMLRSSDFDIADASTERLCKLTQIVGGNVYLCGGGADSYQDDDLFSKYGVDLLYQDFKHPTYPQRGQKDLVAGLSIIDVAMNVGWGAVRKMLIES